MTGSMYGRELFASFVPGSARARLAPSSAIALVSGALVARHNPGTVVEVSFPLLHNAALTGVLRAARHADAIVCVSVPAKAREESPAAPARIVDEILACANAALYDRPLVIAARAGSAASHSPGSSHGSSPLLDAVFRDVSAGFTSIGFMPAALAGDVDELRRVTAPIVEQDLGVEVDLDGTTDPALVLARLDDVGLSLAAVRGADPMDELAGAYLVVDAIAQPTLRPGEKSGAPLRASIDGPLAKALERVPAGDAERAEATAWLCAGAVLEAAGAHGASTRLLDALAATMR
jgi:hypothetical protein